ncbi:MAG: hypothetical protein ACOCQN_00090 [Halanaerobiaceae bacterium]
MKKLLATVRCDIRIQFRNGFYYATAFVLVFFILVLNQLPGIDWGWLLPLIILLNMSFTGFYFIGGIVLLEKGEGTIKVQLISPLDSGTYLLAKIISLLILIIIESLVLVIVLYGFNFRIIYYLIGTVLAGIIFILAGFLAVAPYNSLSDYLLPSVGYSALASLPLIIGFANWDNYLIYLHPLQPALIFLNHSFNIVAGWKLIYSFIYSLISITVIYRISKKVFYNIVIDDQEVL